MKKAKFIALFSVLCLMLTITVIAATTKKNITIELPGIKVYVDGKQVALKNSAGKAVEPFVYNGSVYLPAEALGSAVGKTASWDAKKNTLTFAVPKVAATTYSRTNPAPVGTMQTIAINDYENSYTAEVTLEDVLSGNELSAIMGSPVANDKPLQGYEIVIIKAKIKITKVKDNNKNVKISTDQFKAFTANNEGVKDLYVYLKDEAYLDATLYNGGTAEGYAVLQRKIGDKAKMAFGLNYDGTGGIWFNIAG